LKGHKKGHKVTEKKESEDGVFKKTKGKIFKGESVGKRERGHKEKKKVWVNWGRGMLPKMETLL